MRGELRISSARWQRAGEAGDESGHACFFGEPALLRLATDMPDQSDDRAGEDSQHDQHHGLHPESIARDRTGNPVQTALADFIRDTPEGREADAILRKCVHCGFCNATCPTYQLLGDELD